MSALRVVVLADPYVPVPPRGYGGIERVLDFLLRGLAARGHEVTLIGHPASAPPGRLIPYGVPPHRGAVPRARELWQAGSAAWREVARAQVLHSFGRLAAIVPVLAMRRVGVVQSYQRELVPWRSVAVASRLAGARLRLTACSRSMLRTIADAGRPGDWRVIPNGVELARYVPSPRVPADAPLVFLGRLEPMKGPHEAIAIARAAGRRLVLAGNRVETGSAAGYFEARLAPALDGEQVRWVGEVDDAQKQALLAGAAALLMPIDWEEPFGIVMAEAMACGTPVIGYARGAVPEVVEDGVSGFVVRTADEAAAAVPRAVALDRGRVWAACERRFGDGAIVTQYEALYREVAA